MKKQLAQNTLEHDFRTVLESRFRSRQIAAVELDIPLHRLNLACRGDFSRITSEDWKKLTPILPERIRAQLSWRLFSI